VSLIPSLTASHQAKTHFFRQRFPIRLGQVANAPHQQPVVEREDLEPYNTTHLQAGGSQVVNLDIPGPGSVRATRDHRENRVTLPVEVSFAKYDRQAEGPAWRAYY